MMPREIAGSPKKAKPRPKVAPFRNMYDVVKIEAASTGTRSAASRSL